MLSTKGPVQAEYLATAGGFGVESPSRRISGENLSGRVDTEELFGYFLLLAHQPYPSGSYGKWRR